MFIDMTEKDIIDCVQGECDGCYPILARNLILKLNLLKLCGLNSKLART